MQSAEILGVRHAYELTPSVESGPTLVFIHGWLLSRQYWEPLVKALSSSFGCLTYDLRGFGESEIDAPASPETGEVRAARAAHQESALSQQQPVAACLSKSIQTPYTPAAYAQDLVLLLNQLNLSRVWLVGHSLGGSIGLWATALAPNLIEGTICLNSGGGIYLKEAFDRFRKAGQQMLGFRPHWLPYVPGLDLVFSRIMVAQPLAARWGKQRLTDFVAANYEAALRSLLDSTVPEEVHLLPQIVAQIQQPIYFLAGQQDQVMELKYIYHLASFHHAFQTGEQNVVEIPRCGHMGMLEQTEAIATAIQQILHQHAIHSSNRKTQSAA
jgi:2-succinyl-6-hydroxy-2,4-cyclohexadiene-1-carboxylate synthase